MSLSADHCELLRRLTLNEEKVLKAVVSDRRRKEMLLDERTRALVKLGGLIALDAEVPSLQVAREAIHAAGAGDREIVDTVEAVSPIVGSSRVSSTIPRLIMAMSSG
jgi:alkylhydroperoxidase/carboxymuconolactone decarboxylase family protein YurZ